MSDHGKGEHDKAATAKSDPQALSDAAIEQRHQQRLRQAMDDASLLIAHAAESKRNMPADVITKLVALQGDYLEKRKLTDAKEGEFWNAYSALTSAIVPATVEGIKGGVANKDIGFVGWMRKYPWISIPATAALIAYIFFQIHSVQGADLLKQYRGTLKQMEEVRAQEELTKAVAKADAGVGEKIASEISVQPDSFQATDKIELLADQATRYQTLLAEWNSCKMVTLYMLCRTAAVRGDEEGVRAESALSGLNSSILPLILGLLGACTQVLRSIAKRVIDQSMNPVFLPAYYVRIVLGTILGATIGLFLLPSASNAENPFAFLTNLPLLTASFLAGYAVEIVFALLDKIVGDARSYISGNKSDTGQQPPPPAK